MNYDMKVDQARFTIKLDMGYGSRFWRLISRRMEFPFSSLEKTVGMGMAGMGQCQELSFGHVRFERPQSTRGDVERGTVM